MLNIMYKKIEHILDNIIDENKNCPIAIILDTNILNSKLKFNRIDDNQNSQSGINMDQINLIINKLSKLSKNIKMIDITGFNLNFNKTDMDNNPEQLKLHIDIITKFYGRLLNLKEYSLNIFNEDSKFLIYKPLEEIYEEDEIDNTKLTETDTITYNNLKTNSIGWYLLRNIPLAMKNELLETLDPDSIIILDIPDDDNKDNEIEIMIGITNINEQNEKCYYTALSYKDCCLYPDEKLDMMFELVNII
jgi:hypothetical protein